MFSFFALETILTHKGKLQVRNWITSQSFIWLQLFIFHFCLSAFVVQLTNIVVIIITMIMIIIESEPKPRPALVFIIIWDLIVFRLFLLYYVSFAAVKRSNLTQLTSTKKN